MHMEQDQEDKAEIEWKGGEEGGGGSLAANSRRNNQQPSQICDCLLKRFIFLFLPECTKAKRVQFVYIYIYIYI